MQVDNENSGMFISVGEMGINCPYRRKTNNIISVGVMGINCPYRRTTNNILRRNK